MRIYADNAATTALSDTALTAMMPCFQEFFANPSSLHTPGQQAAEKLLAAREIFAARLGAQLGNIPQFNDVFAHVITSIPFS